MYQYDQIDQSLVEQRVAQYRDQTQRFLAGQLSDDDFKSLRLRNGLYIQKHAPMLRISIPYGLLRPAQVRMLARVAREYDKGYGHFSTRQNMQFNWPKLEQVPDILALLATVQLHGIQTSGNCIRNVTADHLAGVAADELEDPRPWCEYVRQWATLHPEFSYLPRKFKIAIAVPPRNDIDVYAHDLGFVAIVEQGAIVGYNVLVGGGMGMTHKAPATFPRLSTMAGFCHASDIGEVAEHTMCIQRDFGNRLDRAHARFKYTIEDRGIEWFKEELARRLGKPLLPPREFYFESNGDQYGWRQGEDERWHCTLFIRNGRIADSLMSTLREIATEVPVTFALTTNQNVTLAGVSPGDRARIDELLRAGGLQGIAAPKALERNAMACVALPTCALAMAESERYLPSLLGKLDALMNELGLADAPITVRMSGCPNGCSRPFLAEIGFVGKAPGKYNVYLGGNARGERLNALYRENVGEQQILDSLRPLMEAYSTQRSEAEGFGDFLVRTGVVPAMLEGRQFQLIPPAAVRSRSDEVRSHETGAVHGGAGETRRALDSH